MPSAAVSSNLSTSPFWVTNLFQNFGHSSLIYCDKLLSQRRYTVLAPESRKANSNEAHSLVICSSRHRTVETLRSRPRNWLEPWSATLPETERHVSCPRGFSSAERTILQSAIVIWGHWFCPIGQDIQTSDSFCR